MVRRTKSAKTAKNDRKIEHIWVKRLKNKDLELVELLELLEL